jgi:hypothetical protein
MEAAYRPSYQLQRETMWFSIQTHSTMHCSVDKPDRPVHTTNTGSVPARLVMAHSLSWKSCIEAVSYAILSLPSTIVLPVNRKIAVQITIAHPV